MKNINNKKIAITTGGTGGHVFPAVALAHKLQDNNYNTLIFVDKRATKYNNLWQSDNFNPKIYVVKSFGLQKKSIFVILKMLFLLTLGTLQTILVFLKNKPSVLYSFGGYSSVPVVITAILFKVPIIMHEQNAILGKAHKLFLKYAKFLCISFFNTKNINDKYKNKIVFTGLPLRKLFLENLENYKNNNLNNKIIITFLGGSLGAKVFGSNVVKAFLKLNKQQQEQFVVYHQCVQNQQQEVLNLWQNTAVDFKVKDFFENINEVLSSSNVIVCRSGASSVCEINALGKYAIYVPFKLAADNHQFYNAQEVKNLGGADIILENNFNEEIIFEILTNLLLNKINIKEKEQKAKTLGVLNASENLFNLLKKL